MQEKLASFVLSMYLMSTLTGTLGECHDFLLVARLFSSKQREKVWLYVGCVVQVVGVILIMVATQLLFLSAPSVEDQVRSESSPL